MTAIEFDSVTKSFPGGCVAVRNLTFEVGDCETVALVGPSGSGKTTTLRLLAGLEVPSSGTIRLGQRDVTGRSPVERNVAMMFQSDALYPHMSVRNNLSFGLRANRGWLKQMFGSRSSANRLSVSEISRKVEDVAARLGINRLLDRKPHQLSGGERQRVALGRAIVRDPAVFLLDEPLSKLDPRLADELLVELRQTFRELGKPALYVTHDQREAMSIADRLVVMDRGNVVQVGRPLDVYRRPANLFVANFIGGVPLNVVANGLISDGPDGESQVGFRAEHLELDTENQIAAVQHCPANVCFRANVVDVVWLGDRQLVYIDADGSDTVWVSCCHPSAAFEVGQELLASVAREKLMWFDSEANRIEEAF